MDISLRSVQHHETIKVSKDVFLFCVEFVRSNLRPLFIVFNPASSKSTGSARPIGTGDSSTSREPVSASGCK